MHTVTVGRNWIVLQIYDVFVLRHRAYPKLGARVVPRIPVHFVVAERRARCHRKAHPIKLRLVFYALHSSLNVLRRQRVLRLEILMKHAYISVGIVFSSVIQHHIEQESAILTARKRDVDIIKLLKNELHSLLKRVVDADALILLFHFASLFISLYILSESSQNCSTVSFSPRISGE